MRVTNCELKSYYRDISRMIAGKSSLKRRFIKELSFDVDNFINENPDADMSDILKKFGTVCDISRSFITNYGGMEYCSIVKMVRFAITGIFATVAICLAVFALSKTTLKNAVYNVGSDIPQYYFLQEDVNLDDLTLIRTEDGRVVAYEK